MKKIFKKKDTKKTVIALSRKSFDPDSNTLEHVFFLITLQIEVYPDSDKARDSLTLFSPNSCFPRRRSLVHSLVERENETA